MEAAHTVSAAIRKSGIPCDGINFVVSDGRAAGQEVPHVHMHLIPRLSGDGYEVINWKTRQKLDTARIFAVAERITAALASTN
jgi:diadenosine tetraphosphate (Ap4A) HIT family hydrolase